MVQSLSTPFLFLIPFFFHSLSESHLNMPQKTNLRQVVHSGVFKINFRHSETQELESRDQSLSFLSARIVCNTFFLLLGIFKQINGQLIVFAANKVRVFNKFPNAMYHAETMRIQAAFHEIDQLRSWNIESKPIICFAGRLFDKTGLSPKQKET